MKIEKEYDVQELANKVKGSIKVVYETRTRYANIDIITAQEIVDVLEMVASWENKRAKLSDIREEVLKEAPEYECFGSHINGNEKCNLCVYEKDCMIETEERGEKCFGKSYGRRYATACKTCKYKEQCKELTKHE